MLAQLEQFVLSLSDKMDVLTFAFFGSLIEEVISPIPSPLIMTAAGSLAFAQGKALWFLLLVAIFGSVAKTLGSLVLYWIGDKGEDIAVKRFGRFFGLTHERVESFGKKIGEKKQSLPTLLLLRSIPFVPSSIVSVGSGIFRLPIKLCMVATFFGTIVRESFFLYAGYSGIQAYQDVVSGASSAENMVQFGAGVVVCIVLIVLFVKRKKGSLPFSE